MPRPRTITITPAAADPNGICLSQTPGGAGNLTIAGTLASGGVATLSQPAHVTITSAGNDSGRTFTVTGQDRNGSVITEAITGASGDTAVGTKNFWKVTQIAVDDATAGAVEAGNANSLETQWIPLNRWTPQLGIEFALSTGADFTYALQYTNADVQAAGFQENSVVGIADATITGKTASSRLILGTSLSSAIRVAITSFVSGTLEIRYRQGT